MCFLHHSTRMGKGTQQYFSWMCCTFILVHCSLVALERSRLARTLQKTRILCGPGPDFMAFHRDCRSSPTRNCIDLSTLDTTYLDCPRFQPCLQCLGVAPVCGQSCRHSTTILGGADTIIFVPLPKYTVQIAAL